MELPEKRSRKLCLTCGRSLNLLQWLVGHRFCSVEHKREYFGQINQLAVMRLRDAAEPVQPTRGE
jgi:hypothetical protein